MAEVSRAAKSAPSCRFFVYI